MADQRVHVARSEAGAKHHNTLVLGELEIELLYEDETPMADAEFEACFGEHRVRGRTDGSGRATLPVLSRREPVRIFLRGFPEEYGEPDPEAPACARRWPSGLLGVLLALAMGAALASSACSEGSTQVPAGQTGSAAPQLPAAEVTLSGSLHGPGAEQAIAFALRIDPPKVGGELGYGEGPRYTLLDPSIEVLEVRARGTLREARYRLRYAIDVCQHEKPSAASSENLTWSQCRYREGESRPQRRVEGEMLILRESETAGSEVLRAVGTEDVRSLLTVFRVAGSSRP
jgi:hypothetical protein